jgi:hypothetical protein
MVKPRTLPPEILFHVISFIFPLPPPFHCDSEISLRLAEEARQQRDTLLSLCLVCRSLKEFIQPRTVRSPRFFEELDEERYFRLLEDRKPTRGREMESFSKNVSKLRELYLHLSPLSRMRYECSTSEMISRAKRDTSLFKILILHCSRLNSLRIDAIRNRHLSRVLYCLSLNEVRSLTSLSLSGDSISFSYLAHELHKDYLINLTELKLGGFTVSKDWKWDAEIAKSRRPQYRLKRLEIWGRKLDYHNQVESVDSDVSSWDGTEALELLSAVNPDIDISCEDGFEKQNVLRYLVLSECFSQVQTIIPILHHFKGSLSSVTLFPTSQCSVTFLTDLSPHLSQLHLLQVFSFDFLNLPTSYPCDNEDMIPRDVLNRIQILEVSIKSLCTRTQRTWFENQTKKWNILMGEKKIIRWSEHDSLSGIKHNI